MSLLTGNKVSSALRELPDLCVFCHCPEQGLVSLALGTGPVWCGAALSIPPASPFSLQSFSRQFQEQGDTTEEELLE